MVKRVVATALKWVRGGSRLEVRTAKSRSWSIKRCAQCSLLRALIERGSREEEVGAGLLTQDGCVTASICFLVSIVQMIAVHKYAHGRGDPAS